MKDVLCMLILVIVSSSEGVQLRNCMEEDVCSTIVFNQLAIASLQEDMRVLITVLNETGKPGTTTTTDNGELDQCLEKTAQLQEEVVSLEQKYKEIMSKDEGNNEETDNLKKEVENLKKAQTELEAEKEHLKEVILKQRKYFKELSTAFCKPVDCVDIQKQGQTDSGIYTIYPYLNDEAVEVLCDMESDGGGWTVFLGRQPQGEPLDFNESWENFKKGFGDLKKEFWLGNDLIHTLTSREESSLRVDAEIFQGDRRFATWNLFRVNDEENKYQLTLDIYNTTSTMGDSLINNSGSFFTTFDVDNDPRSDVNCALGTSYSGWGTGGWWYKSCGAARPTAPLKNTNSWDSCCWQNWDPSGTKLVSFKTLTMKVRRNSYVEMASNWASLYSDL